jgi:hypothetical protein
MYYYEHVYIVSPCFVQAEALTPLPPPRSPLSVTGNRLFLTFLFLAHASLSALCLFRSNRYIDKGAPDPERSC